MQHIGRQPLPRPLCVQRPLEGCFRTMAMPNEMAPYLPPTYWNRTRDQWPKLGAPILQLQLEQGLEALRRQTSRTHRDFPAHTTPLLLLNLQPAQLAAIPALVGRASMFHEALANLTRFTGRRVEPSWGRCLQIGARNKCNSIC